MKYNMQPELVEFVMDAFDTAINEGRIDDAFEMYEDVVVKGEATSWKLAAYMCEELDRVKREDSEEIATIESARR